MKYADHCITQYEPSQTSLDQPAIPTLMVHGVEAEGDHTQLGGLFVTRVYYSWPRFCDLSIGLSSSDPTALQQ